MTTTELIELLKKHERGGATGRPREVMFEVDDRIINTDGIEVTGTGDGLISELFLSLPSVQPEQLSDAYKKAVLIWLLDYQIKAAELEGRYTPYEVLSWVANDWRKEHE